MFAVGFPLLSLERVLGVCSRGGFVFRRPCDGTLVVGYVLACLAEGSITLVTLTIPCTYLLIDI